MYMNKLWIKIATNKYYGLNDLTTNFFVNDFLENYEFIVKQITSIVDVYDKNHIQWFIMIYYINNLNNLNKDLYKKFSSSSNNQEYINLLHEKIKILNSIVEENYINFLLTYINENLTIIINFINNKIFDTNKLTIVDIQELIFKYWKNIKLDNEVNYENIFSLLRVNIFNVCENNSLLKNDKIKRFFITEIENIFKNKKYFLMHFDYVECYLKTIDDNILKTKINLIINVIYDFFKEVENKQLQKFFLTTNIRKMRLILNEKKFKKMSTRFNKVLSFLDDKYNEYVKEPIKGSLFNFSPNDYVPADFEEKLREDIDKKIDNNAFLFHLDRTESNIFTTFNYDNNKTDKKTLLVLFDQHKDDTYNNNFHMYLQINEFFRFKIMFVLLEEYEEIYIVRTRNLLNVILSFIGFADNYVKEEIDAFKEIVNYFKLKKLDNIQISQKLHFLSSTIERIMKRIINIFDEEKIIYPIEQSSFCELIGSMDRNPSHSKFFPKKYDIEILNNVFSDGLKILLNYYLCAKKIDNGLEIRQKIAHGEISQETSNFLNFYRILSLYLNFIEEVCFNLMDIIKKSFISNKQWNLFIKELKKWIFTYKQLERKIKISSFRLNFQTYDVPKSENININFFNIEGFSKELIIITFSFKNDFNIVSLIMDLVHLEFSINTGYTNKSKWIELQEI